MDDKDSNVYFDEIPKKQHKPLRKWLSGQTRPFVPGREACFRWDYERWLEAWARGKKAVIWD